MNAPLPPQQRVQRPGSRPVRPAGPSGARAPVALPTTVPASSLGRGGRAAAALLAWRPRVRLLPITIFAAVLLLGVRVGDVWWTLTAGRSLPEVTPAHAQEAASHAAQTPPATMATPAAKPAAARPAVEQRAPGEPSGTPGDGTFTPKDMEVLQHLAERREQLDQREKELDQRDAMLQVATHNLDQKIAEMQDLRKQINGLVNQVNAEQAAQLESLVKIYEAMKPADAARIFETMDDKVLINVISRMKEAKTAPVLAALTPKRAEQVTLMLVERKRIPEGASSPP